MIKHKPLDGRVIWVARPQNQAQHLCQLIEHLGGKAVCLPTIEIEAPINVDTITAALAELNACHWAIFVSANAVKAIQSFWPRKTTIKIAAIGSATQAALLAANIKADIIPEIFSSEGLLVQSEFMNVVGKKIIIFAGAGGRTLLADTLTHRGAQVIKIACYQRRLPNIDISAKLTTWQQTPLDVIVITSITGLKNLLKLAGPHYHTWICQQQLLVVSERIARAAIALGFSKQPWIAAHPGDAALIDALCAKNS